MLMNNLDAEVAERPEELVVYGGTGKAARNWKSYDRIISCLQELEDDETFLIQSGTPVGIFQTHEEAPRVLIANANLVGRWANWEHFRELDKKGLMMYGQTQEEMAKVEIGCRSRFWRRRRPCRA